MVTSGITLRTHTAFKANPVVATLTLELVRSLRWPGLVVDVTGH